MRSCEARGGRRRCFPLSRVAVCAALLLAAGCARPEPPAEGIRPVRVLRVFASGGDRDRTFSGTTRAGLESRLSFKVPGTLQILDARVGDGVEKGQLLAALDPRDYELEVESAEASLVRARAQERNAEANLERTRKLYENQNASKNNYDAARTDFESMAAQVDSMEKRLELAQAQLSYTRLTAPVAGRISEVPAEVNENVSPGTTVVVLSSGKNPEVQVGIPEIFISQVRRDQVVEVRFDALPGKTFPARVTEVGVSPTGAATTFPVTARLEESWEGILPGMAAEVSFRFPGPSGRKRFVVPPFAVGEDREGRHLFVVEETGEGLGVARRREVRVGELTAAGIEILEGLRDGDRVVVAGVSRIRDGLQVRLPETGADSP